MMQHLTAMMQHLKPDLIVADWGYLIPHFLRFFILMIWNGLGWFWGVRGA
jgi:hypothetical protein